MARFTWEKCFILGLVSTKTCSVTTISPRACQALANGGKQGAHHPMIIIGSSYGMVFVVLVTSLSKLRVSDSDVFLGIPKEELLKLWLPICPISLIVAVIKIEV